jgi:type IV pilus assembly protein PilN
MIRINLLPYRAAKKKENIRRQVSIFFLSIIVVLLLVFWHNSYLGGGIKSLNAEIASTRAQVAKYKKINDEIAEIKKKLAVLDRKIEVINALEADRKAPVENMDHLYNLLVEKRMWYTQIEENGNNYKLSGIALDNQTVADFMTRLEKSDRFINVRLASIKQGKAEGTDLKLKQFDLNFSRKPTQKEEPAEVKK